MLSVWGSSSSVERKIDGWWSGRRGARPWRCQVPPQLIEDNRRGPLYCVFLSSLWSWISWVSTFEDAMMLLCCEHAYKDSCLFSTGKVKEVFQLVCWWNKTKNCGKFWARSHTSYPKCTQFVLWQLCLLCFKILFRSSCFDFYIISSYSATLLLIRMWKYSWVPQPVQPTSLTLHIAASWTKQRFELPAGPSRLFMWVAFFCCLLCESTGGRGARGPALGKNVAKLLYI